MPTTEQLKDANKKYRGQMSHSKTRNIPFTLTFDEWITIWLDSGHWHERGKGKGTYVMSRRGDKGGYELGNVFIQSNLDNVLQAQKGRPQSIELRMKKSRTQKGRKQTAEWIAKRCLPNRGPYKKKVEE